MSNFVINWLTLHYTLSFKQFTLQKIFTVKCLLMQMILRYLSYDIENEEQKKAPLKTVFHTNSSIDNAVSILV